MFRSYHVADPTTVALILRSGIVLFLKSVCCLWALFGGVALLIEFLARRASWLSQARRIPVDTRFTTHRTGWLLRRILAPMLAILLLLSGAASGNDQVLQKPLSRSVAADWSSTCTLVPFLVGFVAMQAAMKKNNHDIFHATRLLCVGGLVVGPATGHAYARQYNRCFFGTLARGVSVTLINIHLSDHLGPAAVPITAIGAFGLLFSAFYDIGTAGRSVDTFNRKYGFAELHIVPTYSVSHRAPGLAIAMSF